MEASSRGSRQWALGTQQKHAAYSYEGGCCGGSVIEGFVLSTLKERVE